MIGIGSQVSWKTQDGQGFGMVQNVFFQEVTMTICNEQVTRSATPQNPAYLILKQDGTLALLLKSEVRLES